MKQTLIAAIALAGLAAPLSALGAGKVEVLQPWSRPAVAGTTGIGYMVLANHSASTDALEKVESPLASRVEMHASAMSGGIMTMQREDRVTVPAGGRTVFGPGAYHLMLIGLTRTLKTGDQAPATLSFASGARVKVMFQVTDGRPPAPPAGAKP
ncbi:copper chaperone PCu(A)C [Phenylobacterium sp.]|uniref:copper chaperone PCu(A)C n=1 Tax=Phenylobacterium sp. TaxID=1871053 RepID=UPI0011FF177F|nr:copper chaperone PCu(A)C [Phenylobacterium sp.]THD62768.1 MAG: copper chaperone PCu(A)C [Phenylobacterium sp.]